MLSLKQRLSSGETIIAAACGRIPSHVIVQMIGMSGHFQAVWLDHEHCGFSGQQLEVMALAARATGLESFVRLAPTDYAAVTRCLEAGAGGVMGAMIHNAAQAEEFVRWAKFHPEGNRGLNNGGYDGKFGGLPLAAFAKNANENVFVAIQIETRGALAEVDAIAAIPGVDLLFVGPADLSQALGVTGELFHPECLSAIDAVAAACKQHGKHWGAVSIGHEHAQMMLGKGCRLLSPANDVRLLQVALGVVGEEIAALKARV
ncbi:MAG: aldolase/citrate lyase family protein [Planctomycetota bacterium]|nr:host specificity protein [Planctomycetaceae bacterium]MDQ3329792.1 aldolase/citrate lyase family protein [Planctomycetota bacterium]